MDEDKFVRENMDDLPYYCIGFKDSSPENVLRTRIWAALRCQTLYRTVSGFMNYVTALKLLYRTEVIGFEQNEFPEEELEEFVSRKFNLLIAMQNFQNFAPDMRTDADSLFKAFPNVKVAILESDNDQDYYSTLLDVSKRDDKNQYVKNTESSYQEILF